LLVAEKLGIPFQVLDLSQEYKVRIVDYMFAEYQAGRTPNPDVLCNREIKFDLFLEAARRLGADFIATGHYARVEQDDQARYRLRAGLDAGKDQSYFLCQLSQDQLSKALFPIGGLQKSEVRRLAAEAGLVTAAKRDSQGLCFIGHVRLPDFLQQQLKPREGQIVEIPADSAKLTPVPRGKPWDFEPQDGTVVGLHQGAHYFTVGQRKGLLVGGKPLPLFVLATDVVRNVVYVGQGEDHPGLYRSAIWIAAEDLHWVQPWRELAPGERATYSLRIRYRQALVEAELWRSEGGLWIEFRKPMKAVAPGQFAAWYDGGDLVGSGVIFN
jgi:tRNA-specific 2-thiouridylase